LKILICGDSFAADWQVKYPDLVGWPNMLADTYTVTNLAQAGCSEYKIFLQLRSQDLSMYDLVLISHTSPYRLPVETHPVHSTDALHGASDLLYADIVEHRSTYPALNTIIDYYEKYVDLEYLQLVHYLLLKEIDHLAPTAIHLLHMQKPSYEFQTNLDFSALYPKYKGFVNHYDKIGNKKIYTGICDIINHR
jgi:hypothetical protein